MQRISEYNDFHDYLIKLMKLLGYKTNEKGMCFGMAHMAMQALLLNELDTFNNRLEKLAHFNEDTLKSAMNRRRNLLNAQKKSPNFFDIFYKEHPEFLEFIDIMAFFDGVELYQQADEHPELFEANKRPTSQNSKKLFELVHPVTLKDLYCYKEEKTQETGFSGIYTRKDLIFYFQELQNALKSEFKTLSHSFTMVLSSGNHAITVGYDIEHKTWLLIDANQLHKQKFSSEKAIAQAVRLAFSRNGIATFSTKIYGTSSSEEELQKIISAWQSKLKEQQEKMNDFSIRANYVDSDDVSWLYIAAKNGHIEVVKKLIKAKADVNQTENDGVTPLLIAVLHGHLEVVQELIKAHADVNKAQKNGVTPLLIAVLHGHLEIVQELINAGVNIQATFVSDSQSLKKLGEKYSDQIQKRLADLIEQKQREGNAINSFEIHITAEDIATVMGYSKIVDLLQKETPSLRAT